jgi:predicted transcriptional regulator
MGPGRDSSDTHLATMTSDIVAAYVRANQVATDELPNLIETVFATLRGLSAGDSATLEDRAPAVPVKRSVTADFIICLEDGKKFKSLKRHLRTRYKMTPEEYRLRWSLPHDYPMVAPNYAKARSDLAKRMGLGQSRVV